MNEFVDISIISFKLAPYDHMNEIMLQLLFTLFHQLKPIFIIVIFTFILQNEVWFDDRDWISISLLISSE